MSKMTVVKEDNKLALYWEGSLWKKVDSSLDVGKLLRVNFLEEATALFWGLEKKAAQGLVVQWLSRRGLFSLEIKKKLEDKGFSSSAIEETLAFCQRIGAIDDAKRAQDLISRDLKKGKSLLACLVKIRRFVDVEEVARNSIEKEKEALITYLHKKKVVISALSYEKRGKLYQSLLRRGFNREMIEEVLKEVE